jgi:SAM-dependent methyltransferase
MKRTDRLAESAWTRPETVAGFVRSEPNPALLEYAARRRLDRRTNLLVDIGCGAGRNAVPLARTGWRLIGLDLSWPMLSAAAARQTGGRLDLVHAAMEALPIRDRSADLVVAHGIWNLARTGGEFHQALSEAARICRGGGALFVFTFSRRTLPAAAEPVAGEQIVFTQFSGQPQCFVTAEYLMESLDAAGFEPDEDLPLTELGRASSSLVTAGAPLIYQGGFRRRVSPP